MKYFAITSALLFLFSTAKPVPMHFCTAASDDFFEPLINLIGSIHKTNFAATENIFVFDLGLTHEQTDLLESIQKVTVHTVEKTHPDLLKKIRTRPQEEKYTRGWYAWKPVIVKQALDMVPYVLVLDAGTTVYQSLEPIFKQIKKEGYFLSSCNHSIYVACTKYVMQKFNLLSPEQRWILGNNVHGIRPGGMGLSRKLYTRFVLPMYELTKDLRNFADDGTAPRGFGWARHDLTLFSIYANLLKLKIFKDSFELYGQEMHITDQVHKICNKTLYAHTRRNTDLPSNTPYIMYRY